MLALVIILPFIFITRVLESLCPPVQLRVHSMKMQLAFGICDDKIFDLALICILSASFGSAFQGPLEALRGALERQRPSSAREF